MDEQKAKGKAAQKKEVITVEDFKSMINAVPPRKFVGYAPEKLEIETVIEGHTKPERRSFDCCRRNSLLCRNGRASRRYRHLRICRSSFRVELCYQRCLSVTWCLFFTSMDADARRLYGRSALTLSASDDQPTPRENRSASFGDASTQLGVAESFGQHDHAKGFVCRAGPVAI